MLDAQSPCPCQLMHWAHCGHMSICYNIRYQQGEESEPNANPLDEHDPQLFNTCPGDHILDIMGALFLWIVATVGLPFYVGNFLYMI